jgi:hypothetical protein
MSTERHLYPTNLQSVKSRKQFQKHTAYSTESTIIQKGGWQGHNPEDCWLIVFRYIVGKQDDDRVVPLTFVEILCAKLTKKDWSFSGRKGASRQTPTASVTTSGVEKLRSNFVYRLPGFGVGRHQDILAQDK